MKKEVRKKSIGVFDSGFGGLHVLRSIVKKMPEYDFVFLGDNARNPYGSRSNELIYEFTRQGVDFLFKQGCDLVVLACNTASSHALRKLQKEYLPKKHLGKKVLGVIIPKVEEVAVGKNSKRIGIIATRGTVRSEVFEKEIFKRNPNLKIFTKICPLLVPIIEEGEHTSKPAEQILKNYLKPLLGKKIDTLVLGCTHYGIMESKIKKIVGKKVKVVSEDNIIPKKLIEYIDRHPEIKGSLSKRGKVTFFATDLSPRFKKYGSKFFGKKIKPQKAQLS